MPVPVRYPGVYVEEVPPYEPIAGVATSVTAFVGDTIIGPVNDPAHIHSFREFERTFGGLSPSSPLSYAVQQFYLNGGADALIVRVQKAGDIVTDGDIVGSRESGTGIYALDKINLFNLLCIPPLDFDRDPNPRSTLDPALEYCKERNAILIVDAPAFWLTKADAETNMTAFMPRDSNAAVYFPRLRIDEDSIHIFAPCGAVCGVIARTDIEGGVWKSPSGISATLTGVRELTCQLNDSDLGELSRLGLNCLRALPMAGPAIWGARTLESAGGQISEWKYLSVRRLALFIEESVCRGLKWVTFEPNDESLWIKIRLTVNAFMLGLFRSGALEGVTTSEAYFVQCGAETTTQADLDSGVVNILVGFAPLRAAEFIVFTIRQKARNAGS